jgi:hypothetical protein
MGHTLKQVCMLYSKLEEQAFHNVEGLFFFQYPMRVSLMVRTGF